MKRIDKVKDYVEKKCKMALEKGVDPKVDAKSVAKALNIYRSDASSDLNKLFKMGILVKYGKRPVKYATLKEYQIIKKYLKEEKNNFNEIQIVTEQHRNLQMCENINNNNNIPFEKIIGYNGSLKTQIELAKAAVTYPPNGIHTLILGETGVGKSLLAESMWRYGVEIGVFKTQNLNKIPPFVVFNCAEYADNPQLLLSQLFGYIKGAFTGALESREGLVERAQGGILFLDEIHRLPPKGQELLFNLIDKGTYRRLGETKEDRKAQLMIIGATSEDPSSCLLAAFRRRIPVQITLPSLSNRPIDERVSLIIHFLSQETQRLGIPIFISGDALRIFVLYNCPSNIGELKNDLLLCCAKSYLSYITSSTDKLIVDTDVIPQRIYSMVKDEVITDPSILKLFYEGFIVDPKNSRNVYKISNDSELITDLFDFVDKKIEKYKLYNIKPDEIETKVGEDLEKFFYETIGALQEHKNYIPDDVINTSVRSTADEILSKASQKLGRKYEKEILIALTLHLQQFIKRSKSGKSIYNPYLKQIKTKYREEYKVIEENLDLLKKNLEQNIQEDEIGFLAVFLRQTFNKNLKNKVKVIIVSNGKSTATSISEFVNSLLDIEHIKAINAPVSKNISNIINELKHLIIKENEGKGVLILTDMYFLVNMENQLSQDTKIPIKIVPSVSTNLALEVGKKTLATSESLNQIANEIEKNNYYYSTDLLSSNRKRLDANRKTIITICPTGIGTAQKIKEIILNNIPITRTANILTLSMFDQLDSIKKILGKHLCVIIGSINPGIHDIPFIAVNEILTKDGLKKVERLLKDWDTQNESEFLSGGKISKEKVFELLDNQINKFVTSLPLDMTKECCKKIVKEVEERIYKKQIPLDLLVRIYLHSACMCDRLRKKPLLMPEWGMKLMTEKAEEFNIIKDIVTNAINILNLEVPSSEICYFLMSLTF